MSLGERSGKQAWQDVDHRLPQKNEQLEMQRKQKAFLQSQNWTKSNSAHAPAVPSEQDNCGREPRVFLLFPKALLSLSNDIQGGQTVWIIALQGDRPSLQQYNQLLHGANGSLWLLNQYYGPVRTAPASAPENLYMKIIRLFRNPMGTTQIKLWRLLH